MLALASVFVVRFAVSLIAEELRSVVKIRCRWIALDGRRSSLDRWKLRQQDKRPQHLRPVNGLSAHGLARHGSLVARAAHLFKRGRRQRSDVPFPTKRA